jgi:branched-chain amino acid transport system substrate-binding protein
MKNSQPARVCLSITAVAALLLAVSSCGGGGSEDVVRLGVAGPLEQFIGSRALRGAELARDRLNAAGGIDGAMLELVAVTDSANAQRAVSVADGFYNDPSVVAVIGHVNSGATLAAAPIYNRGIAAVSPVATSPEISDAGSWIFRVCPSDEMNAARLADFALRELGTKAAILYANDPYGRGLRDAFVAAYAAGGGTLAEEYPFIEGQTTDFQPYLMGIDAADPDLIFVAGTDVGAGPVIRQAREMGIDAPFIGGDGILGLAGQDPAFDGTYVGLLYHPDSPGDASKQFVAAYEAKYGAPPDHFAALGYDAVMLVAQAMAAVGFDRADVRDYLEGVGSRVEPFPGVSGLISFDENGDPVEKGFAVGRMSGSVVELARVEGGT